MVINSSATVPLERFVFSTAAFPRVSSSALLTPFTLQANTMAVEAADAPSLEYVVPATQDLPEQFRATLAQLGPVMGRLVPLPPDCTFVLAIELRDEDQAQAPLWRHEGGWIAAPPRLQRDRGAPVSSNQRDRGSKGRDLGGVRTTPVRALEAGAFALEVWVEEAAGKFQHDEENAAHGQ